MKMPQGSERALKFPYFNPSGFYFKPISAVRFHLQRGAQGLLNWQIISTKSLHVTLAYGE